MILNVLCVEKSGGSRVRATRHDVDLRYTRTELEALFDAARAEDVENGGRYDARAAAINLWSHPWINAATRHDSDTIGTLYFWWGDKNHLWQIQCDAGFSLQDLLIELGLLELKALGRKVHGW
jgi:hypothetical protein